MLQFTTKDKESTSAIEGAEPIEFEVDGEKYTAYPPTSGQMVVIASRQASGSMVERMASLIDTLDVMLDEDGRERFRERLMDRNDPFDIEDVEEITLGLMEQWSARPTESSSDSSPSQRTTGRGSTAAQR